MELNLATLFSSVFYMINNYKKTKRLIIEYKQKTIRKHNISVKNVF